MDAVGPYQHVDVDTSTVGEPRLDPIAAIVDVGDPMTEQHALGRHSRSQRRQQVGPMDLVVREPEGRLERLGQRRAQQRAPVVPATLVPGERLHPGPRQFLGQPEAVQDAGGVGTDLDASADLAEHGCLLVDADIEPGAKE